MMGNKFAALPPYQQMQVRSALSEQLFLQPNNPELAIDAANHKVELILQANAIADQAQKDEELKKAKLTEFREDRDVIEIEKELEKREWNELRQKAAQAHNISEEKKEKLENAFANIFPGCNKTFHELQPDELRTMFDELDEDTRKRKARELQPHVEEALEAYKQEHASLGDMVGFLLKKGKKNHLQSDTWQGQVAEVRELERMGKATTEQRAVATGLEETAPRWEEVGKWVDTYEKKLEIVKEAQLEKEVEQVMKQDEQVAEQEELVTAEVAKEGKDQTILENCEIMKELCGVDKDVESLQQFFPHLRNAVKANPALLEDELVKTTYDSLKKEYTEGKAKNLAFPLANNTNAQPPLHQAQGWRSILDNPPASSPDRGGNNGRGR